MQIHLPLAKYRFHFTATTDIQFPEYAGSAWRGLFGHQLKRTVCVTHQRDCKACLLWRNCVYTYLFETPPALDAAMMRKYPAAPHPYIFHPDNQQQRHLAKGANFKIDMSLIAKANQHLPYIIHTFYKAGKTGIGKQRGKFELDYVEQEHNGDWKIIYQQGGELQAFLAQTPEIPSLGEGKLKLELVTPCRLRVKNQYIQGDTFEFYHLMSNLIRRISSLHYFHQGEELKADFAALVQQSKNISLENKKLQWKDWSRYSSRQQQALKMGGLIGSFEIDSSKLAELWQWLYLGQYIHLGKGTVMGLGLIQIRYC